MGQRIVSAAARPQLWLLGLLLWIGLSAARSLGTPWALAAETEAVRWGAGIALALALGAWLPRAEPAARLAALCAGGLALWGAADGFRSERGGVSGPFGDHQLYGSVLLVLTPFAVAVALTARTQAGRLGAQGCAVAGLACLLLSQTRSAWAGALAAALVFLALWLPRTEIARLTRRTFAIPAASLLAVLALGWMLAVPADIQARLSARAATLGAVRADGSWQTREAAWQGAARLIGSAPVVGIGLGRYPQAQWAWNHPGGRLGPDARPSLAEQAHSFYLQTAAETGLVGLGLYLAALACFALQSLRRLAQSRGRGANRPDALLIAALSMAAGQAVDALASPSWQFPAPSLLFWAALGVGLAALRGGQSEAIPESSRPLRRTGQIALAGGVAVLLAAQVVPLGLLSPVQAYTPPTGWTYVSLAMTGPATVTAGTTATYTLTATYNDAQGHPHLVDVTFDPGPMMNRPAYYGSSGSSQFGPYGTATRNQLKASATDKSPFKVGGNYYDVTSTGTITRSASMYVQVLPAP